MSEGLVTRIKKRLAIFDADIARLKVAEDEDNLLLNMMSKDDPARKTVESRLTQVLAMSRASTIRADELRGLLENVE